MYILRCETMEAITVYYVYDYDRYYVMNFYRQRRIKNNRSDKEFGKRDNWLALQLRVENEWSAARIRRWMFPSVKALRVIIQRVVNYDIISA